MSFYRNKHTKKQYKAQKEKNYVCLQSKPEKKQERNKHGLISIEHWKTNSIYTKNVVFCRQCTHMGEYKTEKSSKLKGKF